MLLQGILVYDEISNILQNLYFSTFRICMSNKGQKLVLEHKESEDILRCLMASCGVDRDGMSSLNFMGESCVILKIHYIRLVYSSP